MGSSPTAAAKYELNKMVITYKATQYEQDFNEIYVSQEREFKNLDEAIEFHKSQPSKNDSWWEILVSYTE